MAVKDEQRLHLYYLAKLIVKYPRILVFGPYGEGKTTLFRSLKLKFPNVNFYSFGDSEVLEPFVYGFSEVDDNVPEFDVIYCMQYSKEYKEGRTGYSFNDGEWHPMVDYVDKIKNRQLQKRENLSGKTFKSLNQLRKVL